MKKKVFKKIKYDAQGHITETANVSGSDLPYHDHTVLWSGAGFAYFNDDDSMGQLYGLGDKLLYDYGETDDLYYNSPDGLVSFEDFIIEGDSRLSDARTPLSHTHGNLSNDGKIGSDSGKVVVTTTGGALTTSDWVTEVDNVIQQLTQYGNNL